jgi:hypothetical protein
MSSIRIDIIAIASKFAAILKRASGGQTLMIYGRRVERAAGAEEDRARSNAKSCASGAGDVTERAHRQGRKMRDVRMGRAAAQQAAFRE